MKKDIKILGLGLKEEQILAILKTGSYFKPTYIAKLSGVKRTSVNFLLKKLMSRGLVVKTKVRGHFEWALSSTNKIKNMLGAASGALVVDQITDSIRLGEEIGVEVFKDKKNILSVYEKVLEAGDNNRVFVIQGNAAILNSKQISQQLIRDIQNKYKRHKIVLEGIIGQTALKYFDDLDVETLRAYENRMVISYLIDDELVDFDMDVAFFKKTVILVNFSKPLVVVINNELIFQVMFKLFQSMKLLARQIDLNKYIGQLIKNKVVLK